MSDVNDCVETEVETQRSRLARNHDLLRRAVAQGLIADFSNGGEAVQKLDKKRRNGYLNTPPEQIIDAAVIRELLTGIGRKDAPVDDSAMSSLPSSRPAVRICNATIVGVLELDDCTGPGGSEMCRLEFTKCWFKERHIRLERCRLRSLCLRGCRFAELHASEAFIGGPVDVSFARPSGFDSKQTDLCWVSFAGARIGGRMNAAYSILVAPTAREPEEWIAYSKHARYALDLRGTRIGGSLHLRPNFSADGGVCITLAKVEGSIWANGACVRGGEEWSFAAEYADIQGTLYFRPYDGPVRTQAPSDLDGFPPTPRRAFESEGYMSFFAAKIGGSVYFEGAKLTAKNYLPDAQVEGAPQNDRFEKVTVVNLSAATINGFCHFQGWISEPAKTQGNPGFAPEEQIFHFIGDGDVLLSAAVIRYNLSFNGARVRGVYADNVEVQGDCLLGTYAYTKVGNPQPFVAWHVVKFNGAKVRGDFSMNGARIGSLQDDEREPLKDVDRARPLISEGGRVAKATHRRLKAASETTFDDRGLIPDEQGVFAAGLCVGGRCSLGASLSNSKEGQRVFRFECLGRIMLADARIGNSFRMEGARVMARPEDAQSKSSTIDLSGAVIDGKASFRTFRQGQDGFAFQLWGGETALKLTGAKIALGLNMNGAYLSGARLALAADNITVGGKASLGTYEISHFPHRFKAKGKVSLVSASVKLRLDLSGAELSESEIEGQLEESGTNDALDLTLIHTKSILMGAYRCLAEGVSHSGKGQYFEAKGRVLLKHAEVDTDLRIVGCTFNRRLVADFIKVGGSLHLAEISIKLPIEQISPEQARKLDLQRLQKPAMSLNGAKVGGALKVGHDDFRYLMTQTSITNEDRNVMDLRGANIGELDDLGGEAWRGDVRLWLEGFRYNRLKEADVTDMPTTSPFSPRVIVNPSYIQDEDPKITSRSSRDRWKRRALWLRLQYFDWKEPEKNEFNPDAYEQTVSKMKASGAFEDAKRISSIQLTENMRNASSLRRAIWALFGIFFDFGFSVERAFLTFGLCLILGFAGANVASYQHALTSKVPDEKMWVKETYLALFALHTLIPVLDSKEPGHYAVGPNHPKWFFAEEGYAALGWIVTPLVILTASGLLKRHLEP